MNHPHPLSWNAQARTLICGSPACLSSGVTGRVTGMTGRDDGFIARRSILKNFQFLRQRIRNGISLADLTSFVL